MREAAAESLPAQTQPQGPSPLAQPPATVEAGTSPIATVEPQVPAQEKDDASSDQSSLGNPAPEPFTGQAVLTAEPESLHVDAPAVPAPSAEPVVAPEPTPEPTAEPAQTEAPVAVTMPEPQLSAPAVELDQPPSMPIAEPAPEVQVSMPEPEPEVPSPTEPAIVPTADALIPEVPDESSMSSQTTPRPNAERLTSDETITRATLAVKISKASLLADGTSSGAAPAKSDDVIALVRSDGEVVTVQGDQPMQYVSAARSAQIHDLLFGI
jgi:hypothetical protein